MLVYEINTRCWLRDLSERSGADVTLASVPDSELQGWKQLGFTHIWLMGVWTSGLRARAEALASRTFWASAGAESGNIPPDDVAASPYAVSAYEVPDTMGGEDGMTRFRERLNRVGLKLLLDFIPNHVGLDHPWLRERPELLVHASGEAPGCFRQETKSGIRFVAHGRDPNFPPWSDTAQLDYRNQATHEAMTKQLTEVAARCDGVRCDMAMLVLKDVFENTWEALPSGANPAPGEASGEFWSAAIKAVRKRHSEFVFVAEAYWGLEPQLISLGFDYAYNKELYDDLIGSQPSLPAERLQNASLDSLSRGVHFLENHDERRIASVLTFPKHTAAALLILSLPGVCLLHEGQLQGARIRLPVQLQRRPIEQPDPAIGAMYETWLAIRREARLGRGTFEMLAPAPGTPDGLIVLKWSGPDSCALAVINFSPAESCFGLPGSNAQPRSWKVLRNAAASPAAERPLHVLSGPGKVRIHPWESFVLLGT